MSSAVCPGCRAPAVAGRFCPRCGAPLGTTLADYVARKGPFGPRQAGVLGKRLLALLERRHARGNVHGDLRPGTVVIQEGGRVALVGGGESRALREPPSDPSEVGGEGGRWISPEQAVGRAAGIESDLHAVGLLLHYALTGESPWQASGGARLLFEIQRGLPAAPSSIRPGVPAAMDDLVARALEKRPQARFSSAAAMAEALKPVSGGAPTQVQQAQVVLEEHSEDETVLGPLPVAGATQVPSRDRRPPADDATVGMDRPARDDATVMAPRPRPRPERAAPSAADRTVAASRPPAGADRTVRASRPPAGADATVQARRTMPPPSESAPAAPARQRGAWSVGGPVTTFAITGAVLVGSLYGFVWAGYLETIGWTVPPWLNRLVDRSNPVEVTAADDLPPASLRAVAVQVELPPGTLFPLPGEPEDGRYGEWTVLRDPPAGGKASGGAADRNAPLPAAWARGAVTGAPVHNVIPVTVHLPEGRYRVDARTRYGRGSTGVFEVEAGGGARRDLPLRVVPDTGVLAVTVVPAHAEVSLVLPGGMKRTQRGVDGTIAFGVGIEGSDDAPLPFGADYTVRAEARGYEPGSVVVSPLLDGVHELELRLVKKKDDLVDAALADLEKNQELSPAQLMDPDVMGDRRMQAALARRAAEARDWPSVVEYLREIEATVDPADPDLPDDARRARMGLHRHLDQLAGEAAARGDLVAVRELGVQVRAELVPRAQADSIRAAFAEHEVEAWLASLPGRLEGDDTVPLGGSFGEIEQIVDERLPRLPEERRELLRESVARQIVRQRAWPSLYRVVEKAAPGGGTEPEAVGVRTAGWLDPARVARWLDLAARAWPGVERFDQQYRQLRARLSDPVARPDDVVGWLLRPDWTPDRAVSMTDVNLLLPEDRLMLARALRRWGDLRAQSDAREEAERLWDRAWTVYQGLTAEGLGAAQYVPSRLEAARVALLVNRGPGTARPLIEQAEQLLSEYLRVRAGEGDDPGKMLANLREERSANLPDTLGGAGLSMIRVPGGHFTPGLPSEPPGGEERSWRPDEPVTLRTRSHDRFDVAEFYYSDREVTWGQYRRYLEAMQDPATARKFRHVDEPEWKTSQQGARRPRVPVAELGGDDAPVRGVDWWDAFACARFLGGRLPSQVEWEMAARWDGHEKPRIGVMKELRDSFRAADLDWTTWWPATPGSLSVFDRSPTGGRGFWAGVAEWTIDRFGASDGAKLRRVVEHRVDTMPRFSEPDPVMAVRGGSFYHRAPGTLAGESPVAAARSWPPVAPPADAPPGTAPPPPPSPPLFFDCDLLAERGLRAMADPPWVGFRVVYGPKGEK